MREQLHDELIAQTERLRAFLSEFSTETVVVQSNALLLSWFGPRSEPFPLVSPMRQIFFMLGLLVTTKEPSSPKEFGREQFEKIVPILNAVFQSYALMYWPVSQQLSKMPDDWRRKREVAMPTFLHYFNTSLTASPNQIRDRIHTYLTPFDNDLENLTGISASQALEIANWIIRSFQESADRLTELLREEYPKRLELINLAEEHGWDLKRMREEAERTSYKEISNEIMSLLSQYMKVESAKIEGRFGHEATKAFWSRFVVERSDEIAYTYLTELNPVEQSPLLLLPSGEAMCPSPNFLLTSVLEGMETTILNSPTRDEFLRHRDRALEREIIHQFGRLFPDDSLHGPVYETKDLQFEHDLVVLHRNNLLAVEAKASQPREPLRDPERAFIRIRDNFKSHSGLQGAFDQAYRIVGALKSGDIVDLFNSNRVVEMSADPSNIGTAFCICITRDNYGPMAVDLSPLLDKPQIADYPWVIGILDLGYLIDTWLYFDWGPSELVRFLKERVQLHGKIISFDELEVAGFFIEHGSLQPIIDIEAEHVQLSINYSDVFDEVYATTLGGPPPKHEPSKPEFQFINPKAAIAAPH
jgi:hypothetical protein